MKNVTNFAFALCLAVFLVACATGGDVATPQRSAQAAATAMASNDNLIVPGDRVARVFLGMSVADLYRVMGEPNDSTAYEDGAFSYSWNNLRVVVSKSKTVMRILISGPRYSLSNGLTVGSSTLALQSNRPAPAFWRSLTASDNSYCYSDGLVVDTHNNTIDVIDVETPGCDGSGHYTCYRWENGTQMLGKCRRD